MNNLQKINKAREAMEMAAFFLESVDTSEWENFRAEDMEVIKRSISFTLPMQLHDDLWQYQAHIDGYWNLNEGRPYTPKELEEIAR